MEAQELLSTPYLPEGWKMRPGLVGKMPDERWIYMNLEPAMLSMVRGTIFSIGEHQKPAIAKISRQLNEQDLGCQFAMTFISGNVATLIITWESYEFCKRSIMHGWFVEAINQIKCDFFITHIGERGNTFRECIRKQISSSNKVQNLNKSFEVEYHSSCIQVNFSKGVDVVVKAFPVK